MKHLPILTIVFAIFQLLTSISAQTEQKPELVVQTGHSSYMSSAAISNDGSIMASSSPENIKIWDLRSKKELRSISKSLLAEIALSPDGMTVAAGDYDNSIILWNVSTGKVLKQLIGHSYYAWSVAFSPDGKTLVSGSWDKTVKVWDVETGKELRTFNGHSDDIVKVAISPNGRTVFSASRDKTIKCWDIRTGVELRVFRGHKTPLETIALSSDGKIIVSVSEDRIIKVWNVETGLELKSYQGGSKFFSLAVSPDDKTIAYSGGDGLVDIIAISSGKIVKKFKIGESAVHEVLFSEDGKSLILDSSGTIKFLNIESQIETASLRGVSPSVGSLAFSPDGKILVSGSDDGIIRFWRMDVSNFPKLVRGHSETISSLSFSPDGKTLASCSKDKTIKLWNVETGAEIRTLNGHTEWVHDVRFSPDGEILASGSDDNTVRLWDPNRGEEIFRFDGHSDQINSIAFSPDGKTVASGSKDKSIKLWSVETKTEIKTLVGHQHFVWVVEFVDDGKKLASLGLDETVRLWEVETGKEIEVIKNRIPAFSDQWIEKVNLGAVGKGISAHQSDECKINLFSSKGKIATLLAFRGNDWVVTTPDGRFDTNKLENPQGLHWIMPDAPFTPLSFEIFMRDYYEPNLLPRLLRCTEEGNCDKEFKPVRNLVDLNRTQPKVAIRSVVGGRLSVVSGETAGSNTSADSDVVQVTVEAEDVVSEYQRDKQGRPLRSGLADVRLFRDGQLVGYAPDGDGAVGLDKNGKFTKTFSVRLPKNTDAKEFNFTAHAFNVDRVKSETAQKTYVLPKPLPAAKGSAYILTIGVNANEDRRYDLQYAANDARKLQSEVAARLPKDKYERIVQIPLISDYDASGKLAENNATKAKIKAVLDILAGKTVAPDALKDVANAAMLKKVQPEDMVLIAFSGHGYADLEGIFYLVPSDIGSTSGGLSAVLGRSVSSDELSLWLRDIDAGEMMMIIDACHSAAAVQGKEFKPGPMGSRGLGQLSYDKGMKILTATQADNVALEFGNLQHGLLTYSLVKNGIELGLADYKPKDGSVMSSEWLDFSVRDVPMLYQDIRAGRREIFIGGQESIDERTRAELVGGKRAEQLQRPSLFDFGRKEGQSPLFLVR